jgi:UDP-N-acetylmuramate--alanine ligase
MPRDHPEIVRARELEIPVIRRAEALGEVTAGRGLVGVAGTHGKTTTTVMTTVALSAAGLDPTALVGGRVPEWNGNFRSGSDSLYVVEADEYDRSFLARPPTLEVVKNTGSIKSKSCSSSMRCISTEPTMPRQPIRPTRFIATAPL